MGNFLGSMKIASWLILINTAIFIFSLFFGNYINYLALTPKLLFENYYIWTLLTSMFLHASFFHLFFNMFSLFFIGTFVEQIIGRKRFIWLYLASGIFGALFFSFLAYFLGYGAGELIFGAPGVMAVGASGAIFGLLGLLAVIASRKKVYLVSGPLIAIILQAVVGLFVSSSAIISALDFIVTIYIFISILFIFSGNPATRRIALPISLSFWLLPFVAIIPLVIIGLFFPLPIGNMAHLGGLIAGLVYGLYLRRKYAKKIVMLNRMIR